MASPPTGSRSSRCSSTFLQSWNTANKTNPAATADRVLGVVSENVSLGSANGCAEGYATVDGKQAWVRAIAATATVPSMTGALMAMEIGHTLGAVPENRDDDFNKRHSPNAAAETANRAYNVAKRAFVSDDRSAMKLSRRLEQHQRAVRAGRLGLHAVQAGGCHQRRVPGGGHGRHRGGRGRGSHLRDLGQHRRHRRRAPT